MAKRGRKKKGEGQSSETPTTYFSDIQENAVVSFLESSDENERNEIYNEYLKFPLEKMTESIINRYKLYSGKMSYKELFDDTLSFLHTKIYMFDPKRKKKSYSYFGTIIKRRLQNNRKKETKERNKTIFYEDVYRTVAQGKDIEEVEYSEDNLLLDFFKIIIGEIETFIELHKDNENKIVDIKVGNAIIEIARNWNTIYESENTNKFKKNFVLECMRNITMLSTTEIAQSLKFYKSFYFKKKKSFIIESEENY